MNDVRRFYIGLCASVCVAFAWAAFAGWRAPNLGIVDTLAPTDHSFGGRTYGGSGGSWGGGK